MEKEKKILHTNEISACEKYLSNTISKRLKSFGVVIYQFSCIRQKKMQIIRNIPNFNIGPGPCKFVDSFPFIKGQVCSTKCDNILNFLKIQYKHEILRVVF